MISHFPMSQNTNTEPTAESWLEIVRQRVEAMRFGSVQIVVHEGRVTQVESTEKTRLPSDPTTPPTKK
jgi:hypothetical protein